jgi:tRNA (adenine37-N6)-methyltransferase
MSKPETAGRPSYEAHPIGTVHSSDDGSYLEIFESFRPALRQLDQFSHVIVVWWADQHDNPEARSLLQCQPPYAENEVTGVFACRAEYRPNPVALTVCRMPDGVDEEAGIVPLEWIDAIDGTPVLDLKAYFPICDRVRDVKVPEWVADWPEWLEDAYKLEF